MKDYIFNVFIDEESDLVIMTVGGFVSEDNREDFADNLYDILQNKKLSFHDLNLESSKIYRSLHTNTTIHWEVNMFDDFKWWLEEKWDNTPNKYKIAGAIIVVAIIGSIILWQILKIWSELFMVH